MEDKNIKIEFYYDTIDEATFKPKCIIFFIHNKTLKHSELKMNATSLKDSGFLLISAYLEESYDDLINDIIIDDGNPTKESDIELISDSNPDYIAVKKQLKGILRKQKIEKLLN
jgi:hypothetical protein